ncbi:MAG: hypothetical protein OER56_02260, partial [Hyphomicrobiales bacterium]|nr:hypothetical protein [Hyphomicrobiales bacterium]
AALFTLTALSALTLVASDFTQTADAASIKVKVKTVKVQPKVKLRKVVKPKVRLKHKIAKPKLKLKPRTNKLVANPKLKPRPKVAASKLKQKIALPKPRVKPDKLVANPILTQKPLRIEIAGAGSKPKPPSNAGLGLGARTSLPGESKRFDEKLVTDLPALWGKNGHKVLEDAGRGALDGWRDNPPAKRDRFHNPETGPDLAGLNPESPIKQPGGPTDPAAKGDVPSFFTDPRKPSESNDSSTPRNPSSVIQDPRDLASSGTRTRHSDGTVSWQRTTTDADGGSTIRETTWNPNGSRDTTITRENPDGSGNRTSGHWDKDGTLVDIIRQTWGADKKGEQFRDNAQESGVSDYSEPSSQPNPTGGWSNGGFNIAECGRSIPMYLCMRGARSSVTPREMLSQPSEDPGSVTSSNEGPDLGAEAVTNTGDGSFSTTDRGGTSGGGGGSGLNWRRIGDPTGPDSPDGPQGS